VFTPTLTGVAERSHPLNPNINLDTQILDVVNEMKWQSLANVVLVGLDPRRGPEEPTRS
jgi:hypothetical protein